MDEQQIPAVTPPASEPKPAEEELNKALTRAVAVFLSWSVSGLLKDRASKAEKQNSSIDS